jgi:WD40 repeat protein
VAFSKDGNFLASGSTDNSIILWDTSTYQPLGEPLRGDFDSITNLVFNPTFPMLGSGSVNGDLILLNLDPASWVQKSCQRAGRNFTNSEWGLFFRGDQYRTTCSQWAGLN